MAATRDGGGYWLVAADGGIFSYGDTTSDGSAGSLVLDAPITGIAATGDGGGYWLVARDGGLFTYGDAGYYGSLGGTTLPGPVVGVAAAAPRERAAAWLSGPSPWRARWSVSTRATMASDYRAAPGHHRHAGVQRHRDRDLRHDRHGDRQRLHGGPIQLQRRHLPGAPTCRPRAPPSC